MAALKAVEAVSCGHWVPGDMPWLTTYLLDRERENWCQLYENADHGLEYGIDDAVMARAARHRQTELAYRSRLEGSRSRCSLSGSLKALVARRTSIVSARSANRIRLV